MKKIITIILAIASVLTVNAQGPFPVITLISVYPNPLCAGDSIHICVNIDDSNVDITTIYTVQINMLGSDTLFEFQFGDYRAFELFPKCGTGNSYLITIPTPDWLATGPVFVYIDGLSMLQIDVKSCYTGIKEKYLDKKESTYFDLYGNETELKPGNIIIKQTGRSRPKKVMLIE